MDFHELISIQSLDDIEQQSFQRTQVILKHSTRCIVSTMALRNLKQCVANADCWVLDLLSYRFLSNEISLRYKIPHQSPQIIVFRDGKIQCDASHEEITCDLIKSTYAK